MSVAPGFGDPPIALALVGCGRLAEIGYLPAIAATPEFRLAALVDPTRLRRELLASGGAVPAFADLDAMIATTDVGAAIVCSPPANHQAAAEQLSAAGIRCLVEKPPAPDLAGAEAIAALSPAPRVGFNRRFQQGSALLGRVPADRELEITVEMAYRRRSWRPVGDLGDAWGDLGPHAVDLSLLLAGSDRAEVLSAHLGATSARVVLALPRGRATLRCAIDERHRERVSIGPLGGKGAVVATPGALRGALARALRSEHPLVASLGAQLRTFAAYCRGEPADLLADAADGARVMAVIDAARHHAAATGSPPPRVGRTT